MRNPNKSKKMNSVNQFFSTIMGKYAPYGRENDTYFVDITEDVTLFIAEKKRRGYDITISDKFGDRNVPYSGQMSRVDSLIQAIEGHFPLPKIIELAKSIAYWQMDELEVTIMKPKANGTAQFVSKSKIWRRSSFLTKNDKLVYIIDKDKSSASIEEILNAVDSLDDLTRGEFKDFKVKFFSLSEANQMLVESIASQVRDLFGKRYQLLGGSAPNGLMLFSKDGHPKTTNQAQKIAKIRMSGGIKIRVPIEATLIDMSHLDGVSVRLSDADAKRLAEAAQLTSVPVWFQIRAYLIDRYAIKGTAQTILTSYTGEVGSSAVTYCDLETYNKSYGLNHKAGDKVTISEWSILKTDIEFSMQTIYLSWQLIFRSPDALKKELMTMVLGHIQSVIDEYKSNPQLQLPEFGMFKKMRKLRNPLSSFGGKTSKTEIDISELESDLERLEALLSASESEDDSIKMLDYEKSAKKELLSIIKMIIKKGIEIEGHQAGLIPAKVAYDECLVGSKIAKSLGLKAGDRLTIIRYPILEGDGKNSPSVFSKEIKGIIPGAVLGLSLEATLEAMGDFDGDTPLVTNAFIAPPQSRGIDYSKSKGESLAFLKSKYNEKDAIKAFLLTGSNVGIMDQLYETVSKFIELPNTVVQYLMNGIQASIFKMKHSVLKQYAYEYIVNVILPNLYPQKKYPQLWEEVKDANGDIKKDSSGNIKYRVRKHDDILIRKESHMSDDTLSFDAFVKEIKKYKNLTDEFKSVISETAEIKYRSIRTQDYEDFMFNARKIYLDLEPKMTDDLIKVRDAVIRALYSIQGDIDVKNMKISRLASKIKTLIGEEAFYLLNVALFASNRFKSIYLPFTFCDVETLQDIQNGKTRTILSDIKFTIDINVEEAEVTKEEVSAPKDAIIQIWRAAAVGGNSDIEIPDTTFVETVSTYEVAVHLDSGKFKFNVNTDKSSVKIEPGMEFLVRSSSPVGKTGFLLDVELA